MKHKILTLITFLFCVLPIHAATYYVAKTGNDTNPGTIGSPFLTVQKGMNTAMPGDTVLVGVGVYAENVQTTRSGTNSSRITLDGQGVAQIHQIEFRPGYQYNTVKKFTIKGFTTKYSGMVYMHRGAHYSRLEDCIIDPNLAVNVSGIYYVGPTSIPFGSGTNSTNDAASDCVFTGLTIQNVSASTAINIMGEDNVIENCISKNIDTSDHLRFWGRRNVIRGNQFLNNYTSGNVGGNHPDFCQTFGTNGYGTDDILIERNLIKDCVGGLTQFETQLNPDVGNITFKNNIFINVTGGASNSCSGIRWYNNVFYRLQASVGNGKRWYNTLGVWTGNPYYATMVAEADVPSGSMVPGNYYTVNQVGGTSNARITYNGVQYRQYGDPILCVAGVLTYTENEPTATKMARSFPSLANNCKVVGNVFLECGANPLDYQSNGWYNFDQDSTGSVADYNYVAKQGFTPVRADELMRPIGNPTGWDFQRWYEPNGINGGDPKFVDYSTYDFRLLSGSPLIDQGDPALGLVNDFIGTIRPLGSGPDIGAYEYNDGSPPPDPPTPGTPPAAPTALAATAISSTVIGLTWTDNANNEGSFKVDRSLNGSTWTQIATLAANTVSYTVENLTPSTLYYFRVRASNGDGDSANTNTASATTQAPPVVNPPPVAPSGLTVVAIGSSGATLSWTDESDNETGFEIARSSDNVSWFAVVTTAANVEQYTNGGLLPSTTYYYRLRSINAYGFSAWSNSAVTTTAVVPPVTSRGLRILKSNIDTP